MFGFLFLDLREAYIRNLSLLACLEPFEKFVMVVGGWSRPILVLSLVPKLNNSKVSKYKRLVDYCLFYSWLAGLGMNDGLILKTLCFIQRVGRDDFNYY